MSTQKSSSRIPIFKDYKTKVLQFKRDCRTTKVSHCTSVLLWNQLATVCILQIIFIALSFWSWLPTNLQSHLPYDLNSCDKLFITKYYNIHIQTVPRALAIYLYNRKVDTTHNCTIYNHKLINT